MTTSKVQQLQLLQQNMQHVLMQKQQVQSTLVELDAALKELPSTPQAYKIIGKIMVATSALELEKELEEKKQVATLRLEKLSKQEEHLHEEMKKLQKEVMDELQNE